MKQLLEFIRRFKRCYKCGNHVPDYHWVQAGKPLCSLSCRGKAK